MKSSEPVEYQSPYSCNKCSGSNELIGHDPFNPESSGEVKTKCKDCGFDDYWSFGWFESSSYMESNCKTYSFGN